jgi:hypothetical protein
MPDLIDSFPLKGEYPETILARLVADQNAGIDPGDPLYADTTPGSYWDDETRAKTLEWDRLYSRLYTEIPAAAHPATATGKWLDLWAYGVGLFRLGAAYAGGTVRFSGPDGTLVPAETELTTEQTDADTDPVTFKTLMGGTITDGVLDVAVTAVEPGTVGNVPASAVVFIESAIDDPTGTVTVTNPAAITGGEDISATGCAAPAGPATTTTSCRSRWTTPASGTPRSRRTPRSSGPSGSRSPTSTTTPSRRRSPRR